MEKRIDSARITFDKLPEETLVHKLENSKIPPHNIIYILGVVIIILGGVTGFFLSKSIKSTKSSSSSVSNTSTSGKKVVGSTDTKLYPDSAEGNLEEGHINGEGTHKLIRPGGDSQTVYMTSSSLDLNQFIGKKVRVWGQTFAGKKAAWLMDVGKVEQLE